jgi:hypothetical protein
MDDDVPLDGLREELSESAILLREMLSGEDIDLDEAVVHPSAFQKQTRENQSVKTVTLSIPLIDPSNDTSWAQRYATWDEIAEGIGNLQALYEINITVFENEDDGPLVPDWEILACILRRLRHGIKLCMLYAHPSLLWDIETPSAYAAFARAISGQAMINAFSTGEAFPSDCLDILCSALLTLPALEEVSFSCDGQSPREGQSLESVVQLMLRSPVLREVGFECLNFTYTLCQAVAKALRENSEITSLSVFHCSFPAGGSALIASALMNNTKLKRLVYYHIRGNLGFHEVLASVLLSNSTLQKLKLRIPDSPGRCQWLLLLFLALHANTGLEELQLDGNFLVDEKMSTAMKLGLGCNSTLEVLELWNIKSLDDDTCLWGEALSFLHTNTALKRLELHLHDDMTKSDAIAFRVETLAALCENESLETLRMFYKNTGLEDYLAFIGALNPNTTLKTLQMSYTDQPVTEELFRVLKKNYGLEEIKRLHIGAGDIRSILQLNRAGRRYLVQDGSSISKGVDVLSRVSNAINTVFLHLLENPRLCDRSAVESTSIGTSNMDKAGSTSPGNRYSGGKREPQAPCIVVQDPARIPFSDKSDISLNGNTATLNKTNPNKRESAAKKQRPY